MLDWHWAQQVKEVVKEVAPLHHPAIPAHGQERDALVNSPKRVASAAWGKAALEQERAQRGGPALPSRERRGVVGGRVERHSSTRILPGLVRFFCLRLGSA